MDHLSSSFRAAGNSPPPRLIGGSEMLSLAENSGSCWRRGKATAKCSYIAALLTDGGHTAAVFHLTKGTTATSRVYLWRWQNASAAWTSHAEFPTSALMTIPCLISGFVWENSGLALDVAFTLDKIHDRNPEAIAYCKGGGYLFTIYFKWDRNHIHACSRHADLLWVKDKKCGNQNRTAIKVKSLKAETYGGLTATPLFDILFIRIIDRPKMFSYFWFILHKDKNRTEVRSET